MPVRLGQEVQDVPRPGRPELSRIDRRTALASIGALATGVLAAGCSDEVGTEPTPGASSSASRRASPGRPKPSTARTDPLTGAGAVSTHPVVAVKIDNTAAAMPQVGLRRADHVWVQEVEAGITRLVAVFHTELPDEVGPVRSARSTDVELLPLYARPLLVYSGANPDVQRKLRRSGLPTDTGGAGFRRAGLREGSTTVKVGSGTQRFDHADGTYAVSTNGHAVTDAGRRVVTDNVVIMKVTNEPDGNADANGARSVKSRTVGTGGLTVLRDGRRRTGRWKRTSLTGRLTLSAADGHPITLTPAGPGSYSRGEM